MCVGCPDDSEDMPLPDPQYHSLLVRALLAHASSWGDWEAQLCRELSLNKQEARQHLTALLGYGRLDTAQLGAAATNTAVLVSGGLIAGDQRNTYELSSRLSFVYAQNGIASLSFWRTWSPPSVGSTATEVRRCTSRRPRQATCRQRTHWCGAQLGRAKEPPTRDRPRQLRHSVRRP